MPLSHHSAPAPRAAPPGRRAARRGDRGKPGLGQPVFVDRTGRRRRLTVLAGLGIGAGLLVSLGLLILGLLTGGPVAVPGWPDGRGEHGRDEAGTGTLDESPGAEPTDGSGTPSTPADGPAPQPVTTPRPTPPPGPNPTATDRPGQGDLHRNPAAGKPTATPDKPGRPSRSSGDPS